MGEVRLLGNRYRLNAVVGRGGMGTVWRAYDVMLDREVAVKEVVLPPGLGDTERDVLYERTFREARASARLNHPGVVTVHDVVEEAGRPWIVMELVQARSLQDILDEGPMGHQRVAEIGLQMLAALRHAHEKGILHRDVKPSNVLITGSGRVVLTDFGIAQVEGDSTLTQTGLVMGSPAYIPPERAQGERAVPASDLWALGATLYAALEGRSPYERSDAMSSLQAALTEPVPPPRNAGPLAPVLEGLLAREPVNRMTGPQAQPLLTRVASMPPPSPPRPAPERRPPVSEPVTITDETVVDDPSGRLRAAGAEAASAGAGAGTGAGTGARAADAEEAAAETVLDAAEFGAITREDRGTEPPPPYDPNRSDARGPSRGNPNHSAVFQSPEQPRPQSVEPEQRTFIETEWAGSGPSTPPPWQPPPAPDYSRWPQAHEPVRNRDRERTKTLVIVAVAVILVVIAVVAGAVILRGKLQNGAIGQVGTEPSVSRLR